MKNYLTLTFLLCLISFYASAQHPSQEPLASNGLELESNSMLADRAPAVAPEEFSKTWDDVTTNSAFGSSLFMDTCTAIAIADVLDTLIACGGEEIGLMGSIGGTATSGTWVGGLGQFPDGINNLTGSYFPDPAEYGTSFPLLLITDDPPGVCVADTDTVIITVLMPPILEPILPITACGGSFDLLNVNVVDTNNTVGQIIFYDSFPLTVPLDSTIITSSGTYYILKITNTTPTCFDIVSVSITIDPLLAQEIWTGAVDDNWNNDGNWTCKVPVVTQDVLIPNGTTSCLVYSGESGICNSITIETGASLIVQPTGKLEIVN